MRFMLLVKANDDSEAGVMPGEDVVSAMVDFHEQLARAGVLLDANGLQPSAKGWRIRYSGGTRTVIDGPFTEAKELVAGYTLIEVKTPEEALEWAKRMPNPRNEDGEIEVRRVFELDDFPAGEAIERFRDLGVSGAK
jgi:hypothetical protein